MIIKQPLDFIGQIALRSILISPESYVLYSEGGVGAYPVGYCSQSVCDYNGEFPGYEHVFRIPQCLVPAYPQHKIVRVGAQLKEAMEKPAGIGRVIFLAVGM